MTYMTTEQFTAASDNREQFYQVQKLLDALLKEGVKKIVVQFNEPFGEITLDHEDKRYLEAIKKAITKTAKKELKTLDKEFENL